jgi:hypothetical protein
VLQNGVASTTKTARSVRTVHVPQSVLKELREHPRRFTGGLVFTSPEGAPMHFAKFHRRTWRPLCQRAGIAMLDVQGRKVTFHSLRHTAATAAIAAGANIPDVAAMLGHATPNVTLTVYADAWRTKAEHSAEALAGTLFGENGSSLVADAPKSQSRLEASVSELPVPKGFESGGPCRDRTYDQEIKSLLLYQLS